MKKMLRDIKNRGISVRTMSAVMTVSVLMMCALVLYTNIRLHQELMTPAGADAVDPGNLYNIEKLADVQSVCMIVMLLLIGVTAVLYYTQIFSVIEKHVQSAADGEMLDGGGICELRYLAENYNDNLEKRYEKERKGHKGVDNDLLTGAVNRGAFIKTVGQLLSDEEEPGCLLLINADQMQHVNDTYSYDTGDAVLRNIVQTLQRSFRSCDYIGRLGDDEFGVWLGELSLDSAEYIRRRIATINDRLLHPKDGIPPVTLSVGVAFGEPGDNFKSLHKKAEKALYRVKVGGRCGCEVYER